MWNYHFPAFAYVQVLPNTKCPCADTNDLLGQKFPTEDPAVCSLLLPLLWESGNECVGFSLRKWKVLPGFSKVLDIKKWSCLHFQASFLVVLPFGCPLRQFKGAPSLPSICICYFPLPALLLTFLPPHNSSEPNRRCSREIQASKHAKLRLSGPTLPRSKLPVQTDFSSPCHKPRTFFQTCPTASTTWLHVAMIMKV